MITPTRMNRSNTTTVTPTTSTTNTSTRRTSTHQNRTATHTDTTSSRTRIRTRATNTIDTHTLPDATVASASADQSGAVHAPNQARDLVDRRRHRPDKLRGLSAGPS